MAVLYLNTVLLTPVNFEHPLGLILSSTKLGLGWREAIAAVYKSVLKYKLQLDFYFCSLYYYSEEHDSKKAEHPLKTKLKYFESTKN